MLDAKDTQALVALKKSYYDKPWYRRAPVCKSIILVTAIAAYGIEQFGRLGVWFNEQNASLIVIAAILGYLIFIGSVISVSTIALTGPIYNREIDFSRGQLKTWGALEKSILIFSSIVLIAIVFLLARKSTEVPKINDSRYPVTIGNCRIRISEVRKGQVTLVNSGGEEEETPVELLAVWLYITNLDTRNEKRFIEFGNEYSDATLTDSSGNVIERIVPDINTHVKGTNRDQKLLPGASISDVVLFEMPTNPSSYLDLSLPGWQVGEEGRFRFRIQDP